MEKKEVTRREFLSSVVRPASPACKMTMRKDTHGNDVSILGYGAMRLPTVDGGHANNWMKDASRTGIDQEMVNKHVDYAIEHGLIYFDTSPVYCSGNSEKVMGIALSRHERSSYLLATKLSNFNPKFWPLEKSKEMFETSLKNLRTDYLDFYLLHSIGNDGFSTFSKRYIENGAIDWLMKEREAGRIRNLGFSFHGDPKAFEWCMKEHDRIHWDFCQIQMNYIDWLHAGENNPRNPNAKWLYDQLDARKIPVVIMEPLLGGRLARFNYATVSKLKALDPEKTLASWAFRFCGTHPGVMTILSGMTHFENLQENIETFSPLVPLNEHELQTLEEAARVMMQNKTIPCTACQYCMPCPYGIDIPTAFECWNKACAEERLPDDPQNGHYVENREKFLNAYDSMLPHLRQAEHCISCGRCKPHCPQSINIPDEMVKIDELVAQLRKEVRA